MNTHDDKGLRIANSEPINCMECDGVGEVDMGRDWQMTRCTACHGSGVHWSEEDEQASIADALNDEFVIERSN